jgi:hypothetical protein
MAVLYGFIVFVVILIVGIIFSSIPSVVEVGTVLKRYAAILGLLTGIVVFFTRPRPTL